MKLPVDAVSHSFPSFSDTEIHDLGEGKAIIRDGVFSPPQVREYRAAVTALCEADQLSRAGVGRASELHPRIRQDETAWLRDLDDVGVLGDFWPFFDGLAAALNRQAYLGLRGYSVQVARYPGNGAEYVRHVDAFRGDTNRIITALVYLNPDWTAADGGQLRVWEGDEVREIEPIGGRVVLFLSEAVEHAVLPCYAPRMALAAWFRKTNIYL